MCIGKAVRESSHISFFYSGDPLCVLERRPTNTHYCLLEWPADLSLHLGDRGPLPLLERLVNLSLRLRDQRTSLLHLRDLQISLLCLSDQQISPCVQNYRLYIVFSSPMRIYEYPLRPRIFLFMAGYRELHTSVFSSNLLILSANGNIHR